MALGIEVQCKDCGKIRVVNATSPVVPLVDGSFCLCDANEGKCECGCEAFYVLKFK